MNTLHLNRAAHAQNSIACTGRIIAATVTALVLIQSAKAATSASQHGITWAFSGDRPAGQYVNGDWWVVGPVTITSISPQPVEGRNGTMINPELGTSQGFDKDLNASYNPYVSSLNVGKSLPLTVAANSSVVSSITADAYTAFGTVQMFSILTVVSSAPAAGSFRPSAVGGGSRASLWKESQLNYAKLNTLPGAPLTATPAIASYADYFSYPWLELNPNWTGEYIRPNYMARNGYGRELAYRTGDAALLLNLDYTNAAKRDLLIGVVQAGIDNFGFISHGGQWYNDGGHNIGRLAPLMVAAGVLNDSSLLAAIKGSAKNFQEFQNTFFVTQTDVNMVHGVWNNTLGKLTGTNGDPIYPYTVADIGMPEWGIRHTGAPVMDNNYWKAQYRDTNGSSYTAPTMAAKVMGLRSVIEWEPFFLYAQRFLDYEQSPGYKGEFSYNPTPLFHKQFYNTYKNAAPGSGGGGVVDPPVDPPPVLITFAVGDRISVSANTNVRATGALTATLLGTQNTSAAGTIVGGPVPKDANNITWWQVDFDSGVDGWCGQDNFVKIAASPPVQPTGLHVKPD
jgi:hypothetical protein